MEYTPNLAIPTVYKGRQYRSRLEAKWAAFFDLLGWRCEYEPIDLGGWSPDFVLIGKSQNIYLEVKPITAIDPEVTAKIDVAYPPKMGEVLLCGYAPFWSDILGDDGDCTSIGWLGQVPPVNCPDLWGGSRGWGDAIFTWYEDSPDFPDFCHGMFNSDGRLTGLPGCGGYECTRRRKDERVWEIWNTACNAVQWRSGNRFSR